MSGRSIILKNFEVRAFIEGRKSQKRMLMPHQKELAVSYSPVLFGTRLLNYACEEEISRPAYAVGTRLWVRETWAAHYSGMEGLPPHFRADLPAGASEALTANHAFGLMAWKPSTQMPREFSRLTLIVEDVKVERLQDISEDDADAEGFAGDYPNNAFPDVFPGDADRWGHLTIQECYALLWDHINGKGSWDSNPWVAAYTLRPILKNIDAISMDEAS